METPGQLETIAERARRSRRRTYAAAEVPLGIKVMAILTVIQGLGFLLNLVVAPFQLEVRGLLDLLGEVTGLTVVGGLGVLFLWWGRSLYRGSPIALDILIGAWVALLLFGAIEALGEGVGSWTLLVPLVIYGGLVLYLIRCRSTLRELHGQRH